MAKRPTNEVTGQSRTHSRPPVYVTAEYATATIPGYKDNPFIEALPPIATSSALYGMLAQNPLYDESQRLDSNENRQHHILGMMDFFLPLGRHFEFAQTIDQTIRSGYRSRNPRSPEFKKSLQESYSLKQRGLPGAPLPRTPPTCKATALVGVSGGGKTDTVIRTLNQYPPVIYHPKLTGKLWQIPWLRLECPHNGKITQLVYELFARVDELLGPKSEYAKKLNLTGVNSNAIVRQINHVATVHGIGVIVIDELQNIKPRTELQINEFLNFLVTLVNSSIVPIVFVGTMACSELLQTTFRQARRAMGHDWQNYTQSEDWKYLMEEMWKYQWTKKTVPLDDKLLDVIYDLTQGILDLAIKLFMFSQQRAISTGKEMLSVGLIRQVAADRFKMVQPMLDALRSGNPSRIAKYDDLSALNFEMEWAQEVSTQSQALSTTAMKQLASASNAARTSNTGAPAEQRPATNPSDDAPPTENQPAGSSNTPETPRKLTKAKTRDRATTPARDELGDAIKNSVNGTVLDQLQ